MFVTADGRSIPLDAPFTLNDKQYPANWLRLTTEEEKNAAGIRWKPDPEPVDHRFFWDTGIPKDLKGLKTQWVAQQKQIAATLLAPTDWYITRLVETETDIPADILSYRSEVREVCGLREVEIEACETTDDLASIVTSNGLTEWPKSPSDLV
jgi:hypothetical protein